MPKKQLSQPSSSSEAEEDYDEQSYSEDEGEEINS